MGRKPQQAVYGEVRGGFLEGAGLEEKGTCGGSGLGRLKDYAGEPGQRTRGTVRPGRGGVDIISRWTPLLPSDRASISSAAAELTTELLPTVGLLTLCPPLGICLSSSP